MLLRALIDGACSLSLWWQAFYMLTGIAASSQILRELTYFQPWLGFFLFCFYLRQLKLILWFQSTYFFFFFLSNYFF